MPVSWKLDVTLTQQEVGLLRELLQVERRVIMDRTLERRARLWEKIEDALEEQDDESCQGCGSRPGDGITPSCSDSTGCGYWKSLYGSEGCGTPGANLEADPASDSQILQELKRAGFNPVPCGLNADWSVRAWHFGPGMPNRDDGGIYLLDNEEELKPGQMSFSVVRYYPSKMDNNDLDVYMPVIGDDLTFLEAVAVIRKELEKEDIR